MSAQLSSESQFQERIVKVEVPSSHYAYLVAPDGNFLVPQGDGLGTSSTADDLAIWYQPNQGLIKHGSRDLQLHLTDDGNGGVSLRFGNQSIDGNGEPGDAACFKLGHGPEKRPSEYLEFFRANGWVCLTSILADDVLEELERVSCTDRHAGREYDSSQPPFNQSSAMARTAAEPVSLWLMRQYMQTDEVRLGHTPSLALLSQDDGKRNVQGWHSDFPYLWGISGSINKHRHPIVDGRVPTPSGPAVLGIQRNVCISPFTSVGGATAFKLGSHAKDQGPPREWGTGSDHGRPGYRAEHGLPYSGPEADIVEAPGGSIILYDSRTWHRAGVNRTDKRRSAMLQAMIPGYMLPFMDTSASYKSFKKCEAYQDLTTRERDELRRLMIHYIAGPMGRHAITTDAELTEELRASLGDTRSLY